jgi:hypothetical protein
MVRFVIILAIVILVQTRETEAVRMPDIVERQFVIEGTAVIESINFLGFPVDIDAIYELPWNKDTWKTLLPEKIGAEPLKNFVRYVSSPTPSITISGYWHDGETGNKPNVPKYTIDSPYIDSNDSGDWKTIINKHEQVRSSKESVIEINSSGVPLIRITSYEFKGSIRYILGIDDRSLVDRNIAEQKY